jgi:hypothetical protein
MLPWASTENFPGGGKRNKYFPGGGKSNNFFNFSKLLYQKNVKKHIPGGGKRPPLPMPVDAHECYTLSTIFVTSLANVGYLSVEH